MDTKAEDRSKEDSKIQKNVHCIKEVEWFRATVNIFHHAEEFLSRTVIATTTNEQHELFCTSGSCESYGGWWRCFPLCRQWQIFKLHSQEHFKLAPLAPSCSLYKCKKFNSIGRITHKQVLWPQHILLMFPISPSSAARLASFTQQWRWLITSTTIVTYLPLLPSPLWLDPWRSQNSLPRTRQRSLHNNGGRQWGIPLNHWLQTDATNSAEACRGVECNQQKNGAKKLTTREETRIYLKWRRTWGRGSSKIGGNKHNLVMLT